MKLFAGNASSTLALSVSEKLNLPLGKAVVGQFSDGESMVEIQENVRGHDVFILQSTCRPTNDYLMELVLMADALRRASAHSITAVIPYFGYARQDRRVRSARVAISAKVVADMLASVGISRVITVDLHADQIQGFFYMPVDNVYTSPAVVNDLLQTNTEKLTIVSPDVGGVVRARAVVKKLEREGVNGVTLAIIDKRRPEKNKSEVMNIIGDVTDRQCVLIDDILDTGGTLCQAAKALHQNGAMCVRAYCTHPVLSGDALQNVNDSVLQEVVVSDSIPWTHAIQQGSKLRVLSLASILAETILRVSKQQSVSSMFVE